MVGRAAEVELVGQCHCGALSFQLVSALEALPQLLCSCSYCRCHAPRWSSDEQGRVSFNWAPELAPLAYRFAHGTADFLCCARCGILLAAVSIAEPRRAVLNLRCSNQPAKPDSPTPTMDYSKESATDREQRHHRRWTPVTRLPDSAAAG